MHRQVKLWVIILHCTKKLIHADLRRQLLANFPHQRLLRSLPSLHLSARKLPPVLPFAISTLRGEYLVSFADYRCDDLYLFHLFRWYLFAFAISHARHMTDDPSVLIGYAHLYSRNFVVVAYADSFGPQHITFTCT